MPSEAHHKGASVELHELARQLLCSDQSYFESAAVNTPMLGGILSLVPGFESIPAGCVLHSIKPFQVMDCAKWISDVEAAFIRSSCSMARIYLQYEPPTLTDQLARNGFKRSVEVGLVSELGFCSDKFNPLALVECGAGEYHEEQMILTAASGVGPDGHDMGGGLYSTLEQQKINDGYMKSYLCMDGGKVIGSIKLAQDEAFGRLKNVLVHPAYRRQGLATKMVEYMKQEALRMGMRWLGLYAHDSGQAIWMYKKLGMVEVTRQYEWVKPL